MKVNKLISQLANELIRERAAYGGLMVFLFFLPLWANGQTIVSSDTLDIKSFKYSEKQETIVVKGTIDQSITLAMTDNKAIFILRYDSSYNKLGKTEFKKPNITFETLLGSSLNTENISFYFTGKKLQNIGIVDVNKKDGSVQYNQHEITFKGENFLNAFSYHGKFYIITGNYLSSILNLYLFDGLNELVKKQYDFTKAFVNDDEGGDHLSSFLNYGVIKNLREKISYIEDHSPSSIELASSKEKMYCHHDKLYLSFDFVSTNTIFLEIDLINFEQSFKTVNNYLFTDESNERVRTSNYLFKDNLFQLCTRKDELIIHVLDYNTLNVLKEFKAYKDIPVLFKNSDFIRNGGISLLTEKDQNVKLKQEAFFKKMFRSEIGIVAQDNNGSLELTIGGYEEKQNSSGAPMMMGIPGIGISSGIFNFTLSPMTAAFNGLSMSRSVFFKSILDPNTFDHKELELSKSKTKEVQDFMEKYNVMETNEVVYFHKNKYYVGYYVPGEERFIIVEI